MSVNNDLKVPLCVSPDCQFSALFVPPCAADIPCNVALLRPQQLPHLPVRRMLPFA